MSTARRASGGHGSPSGHSRDALHVAGLLRFIKKLHDKSVELLSDVRFNVGLRQDRLILGTYASLIEFCGATVTLLMPMVILQCLWCFAHSLRHTFISPTPRTTRTT